MRLIHFFVWAVFGWCCILGNSDAFQRVCYLVGYNGNPNIELIGPRDMQWHLCTHAIFSFASSVNGTLHVDQSLTKYIQLMTKSNQSSHSNVKFLLSVGGSDFGFVKNDGAINRFVDSVLAFLKSNSLDGIDIDWEFPYESNEKQGFSKLLQMTRSKLDQEGKRDGKQYILTAALTPIMYIAEMSYQIKAISKYVNFVNLMTYDFHTPGTMPYTNHNAPLFSSKLDILYFKYFNVFYSAYYMHSLGLRKDQIMVGIPFYGYLYYLANPNFHGVYALSNGTQVSIVFSEMCPFIASPGATRVFDRESKVPYLYSGSRWISFDDEESVMIKSQWIVDNDFGGAMSFALNYDDFNARCHHAPFPLQKAIYDILS